MPLRLRRCLDCGVLTPSTRCRRCAAPRKAIRNADRKLAAAVVIASPSCVCTLDCRWHAGRICGATADLTADHVVPLGQGGTNDGRRQTLCRRCNTRKRDRLTETRTSA